MKISESPDFLESIANHPRVFPHVSMAGQTHLTLQSSWDACVGIEFDTGGWIFHQLMMGYYEVHTLFLPKSKGVVEKAREALHYMFTATDALEIVTKVPADLPHALALAKAGGFTERFTVNGAWKRDTGVVDVHYLGLTLDEWARSNPELIARGDAFHAQLGEAKDHEDDPTHDAYAGLGIACWEAGQPEKGVWLYNRWALFAGYRTLEYQDGAVEFDGIRLSLKNGELNVETH
ncbi:hypothetical protein ACHZ97_14605 [Lysobacter soli]|uniref:hypothetical protein n=1 Tax=Lysobacter soli TaxID=453783 RepID=UPI0037CB497A